MICYINDDTTRRLSLSDPLICAGLSSRAYNALVEANIQTILDLLRCDKKKLETIRGMGRKSTKEVLDFLSHLQLHQSQEKIYPLTPENQWLLCADSPVQPYPSWTERLPDDQMDLPLDDLPLSTRAYNSLRRAGCRTIGDLARFSYKDILKFPRLGKHTADEIVDVMNDYIRQHSMPSIVGASPASPAFQACSVFLRSVFRNTSVCDMALCREVFEEFETAYNKARPVNYAALYQNAALRQAVSSVISEIFDSYPFGVEKDRVAQLIPADLRLSREVLSTILDEMEQEKTIFICEDKIRLCRMSIMDLVARLPNDRFKGMLQMRLSGFSLREISAQYGLSQERVRQVIYEGLKKCRTKVEEDKYLPIFAAYRFTKEEFTLAFCEPPETFHYLVVMVGNKNRVPISQYRDDPELPEEIRLGLRNLLHQDCICINGEFVKHNQTGLTRFIMRTYFPEEVSVDALMEKYNELLHNLGLEEDPKLTIHERSYINHLRAMDFLLWKPGYLCRYYDSDAYDYEELLHALCLEQYHNAEYSARKFFLAEPALMKKYDIRDEYELHNLLRKVCSNRKMKGIRFKRMPVICFGAADRFRQVYEILLDNSPISQADFFQKYDAVYGVDPNTNFQHYLAPFADYCREGIYDVRSMQQSTKEEGANAPSRQQDIPESRSDC